MQEVLTEMDFNSKVLEAPGNVLVEFFATWCPHCQRMQPVVDDVAARVAGQCAVYQVDVDQSPDLANEYAPQGFPTYVLFQDGMVTESVSGEQPEEVLLQMAS